MNPVIKIIITLMLLGALFFCGSYFASAADIVNVNFPCPTNPSLGSCPPTTDIPGYLNNLYRFAVGIAGLLALGMIVAGGVYYTISAGSGDKQREAKSMITSALFGVALLFGSYLILNTVNPQITKLNLDFTGAPPLPTSTAQSVSEGEGSCGGDFSKLPVYTPGSVAFGSPTPTCANRKLIATMDFTIDGNDRYYYNSTYPVKAGSVVWVYPYFRLDSPGNNACLIYAFREPNPTGRPTSTTLVNLKSTIRLCAPQKQIISAPCSVWRFEAMSSISSGGPWSPVQIDVGVSQAFNYPDQFSPPPALQRGSSVIPNSQVCYTGFCKNQNWSCVKSVEAGPSATNYTAADYFPPPTGTLPNDNAAARLAAVGIAVSSSGTCSDPLKSNCTSLQAIPEGAIQALEYIKNNCRDPSGNSCEVVVTGGTEVGHQTHGPGKSAVDLRFNTALAEYLKKSLTAGNVVCTTAQHSQYQIGCSSYNETEDHLHVQFR